MLQTLSYLTPFIGSPDVRLLDVGCGKGELTALLSQRVQVTAIDKSEKSILAALQNGVDVQHMNFLEYPEGEKFDVVLFVQSLHHIHPLEKTLAKAEALLAPGGKLVVEDFAAEKADSATVGWYQQTRRELMGLGLLSPECGVHAVDDSTEPLTWWKYHHFEKHRISTSQEMREAVAARFEILDETAVPFMYRYLESALLSGVDSGDVQWAIYGDEERLCELGKICKIGYRLVATQK